MSRDDLTDPYIELEGLGHRFGGGPWLFRQLNHCFEPNAMHCIVGPSGSGKTTLLALLSNLETPTEGTIRWHGVSPAHIGWIFQAPSGIARRTVLDNTVAPLLAQGCRRVTAESLAREALERVGIAHRSHAPFRELSGGEAQRAALARTVVADHRYVIADEPTAALDRSTAAGIGEALAELTAPGRVLIVATHDHAIIERADTALDLSALDTHHSTTASS